MITEHDTAYGESGGNGEFEGVAFRLAGDGTEDNEAGLLVVASVTEDNGGASPGLLTASLGVKNEPAKSSEFGHGW
jgi:hypothetical protein